jgi:hypothetical protein
MLRTPPFGTPAQAGVQDHEHNPMFFLALDPRLRGDTARFCNGYRFRTAPAFAGVRFREGMTLATRSGAA